MEIFVKDNTIGTVHGDVASHNVINHFGNNNYGTAQNLNDLVRHNAAYNSHEREREEASVCAPKTRESVLAELDKWARGQGDPVCWLYGPAGAGKSTIAHSVALDCDKKKCLGFSYFFSRRYTARSNLSAFVPSFVYTLAQCKGLSSIEDSVNKAIKSNAGLFHQRFDGQLMSMVKVITPILSASRPSRPIQLMRMLKVIIPILSASRPSHPIVIVIDGLDEYNQDEGQIPLEQLVQSLINTVVKRLHFRILFTSRPEAEITALFRSLPLTYRMALRDFPAIADVENYLLPEFQKIAGKHELGKGWPGRETVHFLAEQSEGIFAYASTLVRFIDDKYEHPRKRLEIAKRIHKGLDSLYIQVLQEAKKYPNFELAIGAVALFHDNRDITSFPSLLQLESVEDVQWALRGCLSVMIVPQPDNSEDRPIIQLYHTSLQEFLTDSTRHMDQFFTPATVHEQILDCCIDLISSPNEEPARVYASYNWVYHLCGVLKGSDTGSIASFELDAKMVKFLKFLMQNMKLWICHLDPSSKIGQKHWNTLQSDLQSVIEQPKNIIPQAMEYLDWTLVYLKHVCLELTHLLCIDLSLKQWEVSG
ncbi:hypothetical protein C8J56DRAFT_1040 [Mycena floridula]|nr:hypothetical protein C8J56DRAFT_1040 [Mycena floridula]